MSSFNVPNLDSTSGTEIHQNKYMPKRNDIYNRKESSWANSDHGDHACILNKLTLDNVSYTIEEQIKTTGSICRKKSLKNILTNINLGLYSGEIVAMLGGSGKLVL